MVIPHFDPVDMRPIEKTAFRQAGNGDPGMMEREGLRLAEGSFTIEEVAIADGQQEVDDAGDLITLIDHQYPDTKEEDDLDAPEEKIHPWDLSQQVPTGDHQQKDVQGDEEKTPEVQRMGILAAEMADRMGQQQGSGQAMEPDPITFEAFEGRRDDWEGNGIHKRSFFRDAEPRVFHKAFYARVSDRRARQ